MAVRLVVALAAMFACQRSPGQGQPSVGFKNILAGTDNAFFTARTRQSVKIKPGVEVKPNYDGKSEVTSLT